MTPRVVNIIDGNFFLTRASCACPQDIKSPAGLYTGGIEFFLRSLQTFTREHDVLVVFDSNHSEVRTKIYSEYKNKPTKELDPSLPEHQDGIIRREIISTSFKYVPNILSLIGIPSLTIPGHEADDIIYFISKYLSSYYDFVNIVTEDQDYIQMISPNISLIRPIKKDTITFENYKDYFPFPLEYFVIFKALIGDSSDNINGIFKVGPVTAKSIIQFIIDNNFQNPIQGVLAWANSGDKVVQRNTRDNFSIFKRNLLLIDLSHMAKFNELYISSYKECLKLSPDLVGLVKIFKELGITQDYWFKFCNGVI